MESKLVKELETQIKADLLIEPVWNRNAKTAYFNASLLAVLLIDQYGIETL